jgi:Transposase IS66 family/Amidohydrolase
LPVEELRPPSQFPQRDAGGIAHDVAGPGPQRRQPGDQVGGRVPGERARRSSGPVRISNVPSERTANLIRMLLGIPVSPGFVDLASERLSSRLQDAGFDDAVQAALAAEPVLAADETPVNLLDSRAGLEEDDAGAPHVLVIRTPHRGLTWLRALGSRQHAAITAILAFFTGFLISDGYGAYQDLLDLLVDLGHTDTGTQRDLGAGGGEELEARLRLMHRAGVDMQILSASPQLPYGEDRDKAVAAARFVNDQYAALVERHPDHFRAFAATPMPHIDASIAELGRALDELRMAGVTMNTTVLDHALVEPRYEPIFA